MQCPFCKEEIKDGAIKCRYCDSMLNEQSISTPTPTSPAPPTPTNPVVHSRTVDITEDDYKSFIGTNADIYLKWFNKLSISGIDNFSATWHWPAFFFGFIWMFYRKLYLWGIGALVIPAIPVALVQAALGDKMGTIFGLITGIIMGILWGITGYYIYYKHAKKKILMFKPATPPENLSSTLSRIGGIHEWLKISLAILIGIAILAQIAYIAYEQIEKKPEEATIQDTQEQANTKETQKDVTINKIRYGEIKIVKTEGAGSSLAFNDKTIEGIGNDFINFEKYFQLGKIDVVLISNYCGGSGCGTPSFNFLTIKPDSPYSLTKEFSSVDIDTAKQEGDTIIMKENIDYGEGKIITYRNGSITEKPRVLWTTGTASELSCMGLYELYTDDCPDVGIIDSFALVMMRNYSAYTEDKRVNEKEFKKLCATVEKTKQPINYDQFKKSVCTTN